MPDNIESRVLEVIAKSQHLPPEKVTPQSTFAELGIDSLDGLQLIFAFEEEFAITIPDDEARKFTTVAQVVDGIHSLLKTKESAPAENS